MINTNFCVVEFNKTDNIFIISKRMNGLFNFDNFLPEDCPTDAKLLNNMLSVVGKEKVDTETLGSMNHVVKAIRDGSYLEVVTYGPETIATLNNKQKPNENLRAVYKTDDLTLTLEEAVSHFSFDIQNLQALNATEEGETMNHKLTK